jgi:alpha-L-rhamnosidase
MLLGDLLIWFYENLAGIKSSPEHPGFEEIIMKPVVPAGLNHVKAFHQSVYGRIASEWKLEAGVFTWNISIPANATALVYIPANSPDAVTEGRDRASVSSGLEFLRMEEGRVLFRAGSGSYSFTVNQ